jgi:hypothetical protein
MWERQRMRMGRVARCLVEVEEGAHDMAEEVDKEGDQEVGAREAL